MLLEEFLRVRRAADAVRGEIDPNNRPGVGSFGILAWLCRWGWPSVRIVALCNAQDVSVGTESYRLGKLCKAGYLERTVSEDDARMLYFSATQAGKVLFARAFVKAYGHVKDLTEEEFIKNVTSFAKAASLPTKVQEVCLLCLTELGLPSVSDWGLRKLNDEGLIERERDMDGDVRSFKYVLTAQGHALSKNLKAQIESVDTTEAVKIPRKLIDESRARARSKSMLSRPVA